ncbi:L,D-transpeptidase catalytic domain [Thalassovita litoralis]|uniref:L,D-transpeptidase catalytic domain n=1 Tax=Thalassovita litoralis TaxID=1010611 RepID=A0A521D7N0_9RHOB|nr:L,D-transpeptidase [Thalassovita litoralis]SMO67081.1 L,D-transpeptidase catalytic domain [Thalassovita litoralis]
MTQFNRRKFLTTGAVLAMPAVIPGLARAVPAIPDAGAENPDDRTGSGVRRNISSFARVDWRDHFDDLGVGVIVADTASRALHFWSGDGQGYKLYPTSVPMSEELTKLGYTKVVRKVEGPSWTPTPSMRERDPSLPVTIPPGPKNPLGTHALYLSWQYYRIHGTHDTRKIGRKSSDGCIGLYNEKIAELYGMVKVGTRVRLI